MKKIIITRPQEDAAALADKLRVMGFEPVVMPLLAIQSRSDFVIPDRPYQAICITSANGIRFINRPSALIEVPVLAVGPQSQFAAQAVGFNHVAAQGGDVIGLAQYVVSNLQPTRGPILYLSGAETSGDLEGRLRDHGFDVDRIVTYDAVPTNLLGQETAILAAQAVLLYSPRTAKLWQAQATALNLASEIAAKKHFCLSANVAQALPQNWHKICVQAATEQAMLAALDCWHKEE